MITVRAFAVSGLLCMYSMILTATCVKKRGKEREVGEPERRRDIKLVGQGQ